MLSVQPCYSLLKSSFSQSELQSSQERKVRCLISIGTSSNASQAAEILSRRGRSSGRLDMDNVGVGIGLENLLLLGCLDGAGRGEDMVKFLKLKGH